MRESPWEPVGDSTRVTFRNTTPRRLQLLGWVQPLLCPTRMKGCLQRKAAWSQRYGSVKGLHYVIFLKQKNPKPAPPPSWKHEPHHKVANPEVHISEQSEKLAFIIKPLLPREWPCRARPAPERSLSTQEEEQSRNSFGGSVSETRVPFPMSILLGPPGLLPSGKSYLPLNTFNWAILMSLILNGIFRCF